ncbi:unnamed protein product [Cuscuta europaea]|uniref:Uncharacterized protein n=1 Tax=Cuscuta europaea TaxID=41803 RepID=A0A9P1EI69_CUSEU|nr:unnamed protein product [Cuscuta europaea]
MNDPKRTLSTTPAHTLRPNHHFGGEKLCKNSIFIHHTRTKNKGGRRRGKEKRKVGFGEENLCLTRNFTELKRSPELSPEFVEVRRSFAGAKSGRLELHKLH